ncbi:MAG: SAM-dependent methyltransferase [Candidatus Omnitrophota bacterium]
MQTKGLLENKYLTRPGRYVFYQDESKLIIAFCININGNRPKSVVLRKPFEREVFLALNGVIKTKALAKKLSSEFNEPTDKTLVKLGKLIKRYNNSHPGLFKIEDTARIIKKRNKNNLRYLRILETIKRELGSTKNLKSDYLDLRDYHLSKIKDPDRQFDKIETTVSHTFRMPHPALGGLTYGQGIKQELLKRRPLSKNTRILEIGAGTGWLGRRFLDSLKKENNSIYKNTKYIFLDLSPALLKSQKIINKPHSKCAKFLLADGMNLPFRDDSFDYVIVNEVIADFDVVKLDKEKLENMKPRVNNNSKTFAAGEVISKYNIPINDAPKRFLFGLGIVKLLEELRRTLKPGGLALIVEYGSNWGYPVATRLREHREHTVHFGHLKHVAEASGFRVKTANLLDFLKFKKDIRTLHKCSLCLLKKILQKRQRKIPSSILTKELLCRNLHKDYSKFGNLRFIKIKEGISGFQIQGFKVVTLYKPKTAD